MVRDSLNTVSPDKQKQEFQKKAKERQCLERFLRALDLEKNWSIESRERPDFSGFDGRNRIGIELTRLFHEAPGDDQCRREKESLRDQVCRLIVIK